MIKQLLSAVFIAAGATSLSACGTITQGTSQDIAISSNPEGGHCELTRKGKRIASLEETPGTITVSKTKNNILLTCDLAGYQTASTYLNSGYGAGTFGNILLGGVIGWGIDSATGADNKYPSTATVNFVPVGMAAPTAPAQRMPPANPTS